MKRAKKELSRDEQLKKLKAATVYMLIYWGLGIFIVDGTLYAACDRFGMKYSLDSKSLFFMAGGAYLLVFAIAAVFYALSVVRYNFPGVFNKD